MRVLHLTRDFPPGSAGGISTAVGWLVRGMASEGWPQAVVSFDGWRPKRQAARASVEGGVLRVQGEAWDAVQAFSRAHAPDLTLIHDPLIDQRCGALPGRRGIVVHVDHEQLCAVRGITEVTASRAAQERSLASAELVLAPSQAVVDRLVGRGAVGRGELRRARFGVERAEGVEGAGGAAAGPVVYVGRFDVAKGTRLLLEAMRGLGRPVLAGGLPHNPRAEARWKQEGPDADWRGWLDPTERDALLRSAALVAVPSWEETLGLVALEAIRLGVPVVASDVGGLGEILRDTGGGVLLPPHDVDAWRSTIRELLADPARRAHLARTGRAAVEASWTWPALRPEWGGDGA